MAGVNWSYLVVFVGGVVLEKDDALAVQTPVVPLSLLVVRVRWDESGQQRHDGGSLKSGIERGQTEGTFNLQHRCISSLKVTSRRREERPDEKRGTSSKSCKMGRWKQRKGEERQK